MHRVNPMKRTTRTPSGWIVLFLLGIAACGGESAAPREVTLEASSGPAASMLEVYGLDLASCPLRTSEIRVGGETAPAVVGASGEVVMRLPLFYDEAMKWAAPPSEPQDVEVFCNGRLWTMLPEALTVTELPPAPGTTQTIVADYAQISADYRRMLDVLVPEPGVQQQLFAAFFSALDEALTGTDPSSLPVLLGDLSRDDPEGLALMDAVHAASGVDQDVAAFKDFIEEMSAQAVASAGAAPAGTPAGPAVSAPKAAEYDFPIPIIKSDIELAKAMQSYVVLDDFSQQVIKQTSEKFSTGMGLLSVALRKVPASKAVSIFLLLADYVMNKLVVSALPANLDLIDLAIPQTKLQNSEVTHSSFILYASNVPAKFSISDMTSIVLTVLGIADKEPATPGVAADWINSLEELLPQVTMFLLERLHKAFEEYALVFPEGIKYDRELFSVVPKLHFQAFGETRELYVLHPEHSEAVAPLADALEWQASPTHWGSAEVYITPGPGPEGGFWGSLYTGRAFGVSDIRSNGVVVTVGDLSILIDQPTVSVPEGGSAAFGVKLSNPPADAQAAVVVNVEGKGGDQDISIISGQSISFNESNWNAFQPVMLAAAEDEDDEDGQATISASALVDFGDEEPRKVIASIEANEVDNDRLKFVSTEASVKVPEGETATFGLKLNQSPPSAVKARVRHSSGDPDLFVEYPSNLRFNSSNWNTFQTVTLYALTDEDSVEGSAQIRIAADPPARVDDLYIRATEDEPGDLLSFRWVLDGIPPYQSIYTVEGTVPVAIDDDNLSTPLGSATVSAMLTVHYGDPPIQATGSATLTVRTHWSDTICYCGSPVTESCHTKVNDEDHVLAVDVQFNLPSIQSLIEERNQALAEQKGEARRDIVVIVGEDSPYSVHYDCGGITGDIQASLH